MTVFIIILSVIDMIFGFYLWFQVSWIYGVPIIVSAIVMIWLAAGAAAGYDASNKLKGIKMDYLKTEAMERQRITLKVVCKKLNITEEELSELVLLEEIDAKKDIPFSKMTEGFEVVLLEDICTQSGVSIPSGTIGRFCYITGNRIVIEFNLASGQTKVGCSANQLMNRYKYIYERKIDKLSEKAI